MELRGIDVTVKAHDRCTGKLRAEKKFVSELGCMSVTFGKDGDSKRDFPPASIDTWLASELSRAK